MAMAKKKSTSFVGYGTDIKRGKAIAKTVAAKVKNSVTASGGPGAAGMKSRAQAKANAYKSVQDIPRSMRTSLNKFNPDNRAMVAESKRRQANAVKRKQTTQMNKKRG